MVTDDLDMDIELMYIDVQCSLMRDNQGSFILFYRAYFDPEYLIKNPSTND